MATIDLPPHVSARQRLRARLAIAAARRVFPPSDGSDVPSPDSDPFYETALPAPDLRHGELLEVREVEVRAKSKPLGQPAFQLRYVSTDARDERFVATATLLVPEWRGAGPQPLVSYQVPINSLSADDFPSVRLRRGTLGMEISFLRSLLGRGFAVVTADFTGPRRSFGQTEIVGRSVLDGISAALATGAGTLDPQSPVGLWGFSGAGTATLFAGELAPEYAPDLAIRALVAGGPSTDPRSTMAANMGTMRSNAPIAFVIGLTLEHPDIDLESVLTDEGRATITRLRGRTILEGMAAAPYRRWSDLLTVGDIDLVPGMSKALDAATLPQGTPRADVYVYQGLRDRLVPAEATDRLVERYRQAGVPVEYRRIPLIGHFVSFMVGARGAIRFFEARLEHRTDHPR